MTIARDIAFPSLNLRSSAPKFSQRWTPATWENYLRLRDDESCDFKRIAFHTTKDQLGWLWVDMSNEGLSHAKFSDLMTMIFYIWVLLHPNDDSIESLGRCLMELPDTHGCSPDLVLYKGDNIPTWSPGEARRIDLSRHRLPDLVGEISDTSLRQDLDEQKAIYQSLGIAEYWVINVKACEVTAFQLNESGLYEICQQSQVLPGLPIALLTQTIEKLTTSTNTIAADWFRRQLQAMIETTL
jgi:Uma2 family endonuclease